MLKLFFLIDKYLLIDLLYHFISNIIKFSVKITDNAGVGNRESDSIHHKTNYLIY